LFFDEIDSYVTLSVLLNYNKIKKMGVNNSCVYCGSDAQVRDHVIPVSFLGSIRSYDNSQYWIVDSCEICNSLAGNKIFLNIPNKAKFIKKRYLSKFKKVLRTPEWSEEEMGEMGEMGYKLKKMIFSSMVAKRVILTKINYLSTVENMNKKYSMPTFIELRMKEFMEEGNRRERLLKSLMRKKNGK